MRTPATAALVLAIALSPLTPATAQRRPIELGIDMFNFGLLSLDADILGTFTATNVAIPVGVIRAGFFISDFFAIEPRIYLRYADVEDVGSSTNLGLLVGVPVHFTKDRQKPQGFVRPCMGFYSSSADPGDSYTQLFTGLGVGVKLPVVEMLSARMEGIWGHYFENDDALGGNSFDVRFGFSFLTRR